MPDRVVSDLDLEDIRRQERLAQQTHDTKGLLQAQASADRMAQAVVAALAPALAKLVAPPPPPLPPAAPEKDVPAWIKVTGAICALFISIATALGIVWGVAIGPVQTRLDVLEKGGVAQLATITAMGTRMAAAENKLAQLETTITTAGRIRDQQQQGIADQVRGLSQADQQATERLATLSNTIASILPRLEEILRRQERLENRLGTQRSLPNSDDTPAVFWLLPPHAI